jgi:hypothetical protein
MLLGRCPVRSPQSSHRGLQIGDVLVHLDIAQMFDRVLPDVGILTGFVGRAPQHAGGGQVTGVRGHLSRQDLQKGGLL